MYSKKGGLVYDIVKLSILHLKEEKKKKKKANSPVRRVYNTLTVSSVEE